jgi:hypothetical protein
MPKLWSIEQLQVYVLKQLRMFCLRPPPQFSMVKLYAAGQPQRRPGRLDITTKLRTNLYLPTPS